MPVSIDTVKITPELSSNSVDWLLGNVGDKITIELDISIQTSFLSSGSNKVTINNRDGYLEAGWITDKAQRFADFRIGDSMYLFNYVSGTAVGAGTYTIIDKLSNGEIKLSPVPSVGDNVISTENAFSVSTPVRALFYNWNFIENSEAVNFNSKVDATIQQLIVKLIDGTDPITVNDMEFLGSKCYQIGSATAQGISANSSTGVYVSKFKIIHSTYITPFFLAEQWSNLQTATAPNYFFNANCLKAIFDINAAYNYTDPNRIQTVTYTSILGNSGWFNENFNTGKTNYKIASVTYKDSAPKIIPAVQLSTEITSVEVIINNTTDSPFSNNNTQFAINFIKAPFDASEYQGNGIDMSTNFCFDRALQTVGSVAVNGDKYSSSGQVLKNITGTWISNTQLKINFDVSMVSTVVDVINQSSTPQYLLWVTTQNYTLQTEVADKVSLFVDARDFYIDITDDGLLSYTNLFLRHPESDPTTQGIEPQDAVMSYSWTAWSGGSATFNLSMFSTVAIGATPSFTVTGQSTIAGAMTALAAALLIADPSCNAVADIGSQILSFAPKGATNTDEIIFSSTGSHPTISPSIFLYAGQQVIDVMPEDEVVAYTQLTIDKTGRETDNIKIESITTKIKAKNSSTLDEFDLDTFFLNTTAYPFIAGNQYFDIEIDRIFHIPEGSIRKMVQVRRRPDLDAGEDYYYEAWYPFLIRWEYWASLLNANSVFFDVAQSNNGWNEFWHRYSTVTNWKLYYSIITKINKNGNILTYIKDVPMVSHDYDSNSDYTAESIKAYDPDTMTELYDSVGMRKFILGYKKTLIIAKFTKISAAPILAHVTVNMGIEVFEQGGIGGRRRMSSRWASDTDTWFASLDTTNKVQISLSGNTITAQCLVDNNQIPLNKTEFKIVSRIYEIADSGDGKATELGVLKLTEGGNFKIIE